MTTLYAYNGRQLTVHDATDPDRLDLTMSQGDKDHVHSPIFGNFKRSEVLDAIGAIPKHVGAWVDQYDAMKAERDALAATVERVREVLDGIGRNSVFVCEVRAALDPKPAFVLPTEAGVRFEAQYGNNDTTDVLQAVSYCDAEGGAMTLYLREANLVAYTAGEVVAKFKNHRLLDGAE